MTKVFISYRRDDSADITGRLYDHLTSRYGSANIFKDVDSIPLGMDFRTHLGDAVAKCEAVIVVIGPRWSGAAPDGTARLNDPGDFVRIEVEQALARQIPVIPVLVGGVTMPKADALPDSLRDLVFRNAMQLRPDPDFRGDLSRLFKGLERLTAITPRTSGKPTATSPPAPLPAPPPASEPVREVIREVVIQPSKSSPPPLQRPTVVTPPAQHKPPASTTSPAPEKQAAPKKSEPTAIVAKPGTQFGMPLPPRKSPSPATPPKHLTLVAMLAVVGAVIGAGTLAAYLMGGLGNTKKPAAPSPAPPQQVPEPGPKSEPEPGAIYKSLEIKPGTPSEGQATPNGQPEPILDEEIVGDLLVTAIKAQALREFERTLTARIDELFEQGKDAEAIQLLRDAVKTRPESAGAWSELGRVLTPVDTEEALRALNEAVRLRPDDALALARRGALHAQMGHATQAKADVDRAVELDRTQSKIFVNRSRAYKRMGDLGAALESLSEAIKLEPLPDLYTERAVLVSPFDQALAKADFDKAISLKPSAYALASRGNFLLSYANNDPKQLALAETDCTEALKLDAKFHDAHKVRAAVRSALEKYAGAVDDLSEYLRAVPNDGNAYRDRAVAYGSLGRHDDSIRDFKLAIEKKASAKYIELDLSDAYVAKAQSLKPLRNQAEAAIEACTQAIAVCSDFVQARTHLVPARDALGRAYFTRAQCAASPADSLTDLEKASELGYSDATKALANLFEKGGPGIPLDLVRSVELARLAKDQRMLTLTVPCVSLDGSGNTRLRVWVTTPRDRALRQPLEDELSRLREDFNATIGEAELTQFRDWWRTATTQNTPFPDVVDAALDSEEAAPK